MPVASERRAKTRTKRVSPLPAIVLSSLRPDLIELTPGLEHMECPDCGTWCPITGMQGTPKLVPHHTDRAGTPNPRRCRSSNRKVTIDVTGEQWNELAAARADAAVRRATKVLRKPKTPPAPPVSKLVAPARGAAAARRDYEMHRKTCAGCTRRSTCDTGQRLLAVYVQLLQLEPERRKSREFFARERARFDRQYAASARETNQAMWAKAGPAPRAETAKRSGTAVEDQNNTSKSTRPGAVSELRAPEVPQTTLHPGGHRPEPSGPECACCGATEINLVHAAAAGWRKVKRRHHCGTCAEGFPAWMVTQI
jgi:hypothetical protein